MLLRHWTLYDSMYHSQYVASRLGIWRHPGRRKLQTFLAKMGIPLKECQQKYAFMSIEFKKLLRAQIDKYAPVFGLDDILYGSFYRVIHLLLACFAILLLVSQTEYATREL